MATLACDKFFTLPELIAHLPPLLSINDVAHFSQTNRLIHSISILELWRQVNFGTSSRIIDSPDGLKAFSKNVNSIRSLYWSEKVSWYYIHALWMYLNSPANVSETHQSIQTDAITHPSWGQLSDATLNNISHIQPLPPMLHLTEYLASFGCHRPEPTFQPQYSINTHEPHLHHLLWFIRLNRATLTTVNLYGVPFLSIQLIRDLCRTISQLDHLKILKLGDSYYRRFNTFQVFKLLLLSCPGSLAEFSMRGAIDMGHGKLDMDPEYSSWDYDQGPLVLRHEPLHHLTTLELPWAELEGGYPAPFLCSVLEHCPAIKRLVLPSIYDKAVADAVAQTMRSPLRSPITDLEFPFSRYNNQATFMTIMAHGQEQCLQRLDVMSFSDDSSRTLSFAAFLRHSESLREIKLTECWDLKSTTLQAILVSCRALESFTVQKTGITRVFAAKVALSLTDAVETEWSCTRIRHLSLTVSLTPDGRDPAYLSDPTMSTWTEQDHQHWKMLDVFYTQIGSLKELQFLNLEAAGSHSSNEQEVPTDIYFRDTCLPGLLALEDPGTGQIGYLSRWSGLKKLRQICGSFSLTNKEATARMSEREVDWFVNHMPALRWVALLTVPLNEAFPDNAKEVDPSVELKYPKLIRDIQRQRPELNSVEFVY
jgi:hypothetical protein